MHIKFQANCFINKREIDVCITSGSFQIEYKIQSDHRLEYIILRLIGQVLLLKLVAVLPISCSVILTRNYSKSVNHDVSTCVKIQ